MSALRLYSRLVKQNLRSFSTSSVCHGKRNFRKFPLHNFRGSRQFREKQKVDPDPEIPPYTYGVRETGYKLNGQYHEVPEMIPELVVPNLKDFQLKPYVSYRAPDVVQDEFTSIDLFNAIYSKKIRQDFIEGKLDEDGNPLEPNALESLTAEEAKAAARKTGSDIFMDEIPVNTY